MTLVIVTVALLVLAGLSVRFGADSRRSGRSALR
jgi:hypothetical protein